MEEKHIQYSIKLISAIRSCFDEESENYIDIAELTEGDNLTHFMHALANIMPSHVYASFTKDNLNTLDFNHVANKLVFQYSKNNAN